MLPLFVPCPLPRSNIPGWALPGSASTPAPCTLPAQPQPCRNSSLWSSRDVAQGLLCNRNCRNAALGLFQSDSGPHNVPVVPCATVPAHLPLIPCQGVRGSACPPPLPTVGTRTFQLKQIWSNQAASAARSVGKPHPRSWKLLPPLPHPIPAARRNPSVHKREFFPFSRSSEAAQFPW